MGQITESNFRIENSFLSLTKSEVIGKLVKFGEKDLIGSAVSCSRTFKTSRYTTHCGECSQCIDRRLSAFAATVELEDNPGLYDFDFLRQKVSDLETKTTLIDYIRQARDFAQWNEDTFYYETINELVLLQESGIWRDESEFIHDVFSLCQRHGEQVLCALKRMREQYDDPYTQLPSGSLF